jgi:predicted small metal-binding protein
MPTRRVDGRAGALEIDPCVIVRPAGPPPKGAVMPKAIRCECGYVASGDTDDQVIEAIRAHMATDHPQLLEKVTREDLFGWIEDV